MGFSGTGLNLQSFGQLVFGLNSSNAKNVKIEFEDNVGNRAIFYAAGVDVTKNYYKFLASSLQGSIDATKIKKIYFSVNDGSFDASPSSGNFILELLGIPS